MGRRKGVLVGSQEKKLGRQLDGLVFDGEDYDGMNLFSSLRFAGSWRSRVARVGGQSSRLCHSEESFHLVPAPSPFSSSTHFRARFIVGA